MANELPANQANYKTLNLNQFKNINNDQLDFILKEIEYSSINQIEWPHNFTFNEDINTKINNQLLKNNEIILNDLQNTLESIGNIYSHLTDYNNAII